MKQNLRFGLGLNLGDLGIGILEFMKFLYFLYLLTYIAASGGQFSRTLGMGAIQNEKYLE